MKNQMVALVIALVYGSAIPYSVIDFFLNSLGINNFFIKQIVPYGTILDFPFHMNSETAIRVIIIAVIYGVIAVILHIMIKNRQGIIT